LELREAEMANWPISAKPHSAKVIGAASSIIAAKTRICPMVLVTYFMTFPSH
jgi:hypothetical protein